MSRLSWVLPIELPFLFLIGGVLKLSLLRFRIWKRILASMPRAFCISSREFRYALKFMERVKTVFRLNCFQSAIFFLCALKLNGFSGKLFFSIRGDGKGHSWVDSEFTTDLSRKTDEDAKFAILALEI